MTRVAVVTGGASGIGRALTRPEATFVNGAVVVVDGGQTAMNN